MRGQRIVGCISLFLVSIILLSVYGPWDFLGAYKRIQLADKYLKDDAYCIVTGDIYHKEIKNDKPVYYLRDATIEVDQIKLFKTSLILYLNSDEIPNKSKIKVDGKISLFDVAKNDGNFDSKTFYNSKGLVCKVKGRNVLDCTVSYVYSHDYMYKLQKRISAYYERLLPGEEAGFLSSIVLGEKSGLKGELKGLFQNAGVAHVLAVSGLHVSFLCMGVYSALRKRGVSFIGSAIVSGVVAVLYGILTGGSVSSIRAIGMFIIYLISQVTGESYDMITALSVMASLLLIRNPLYVRDGSFIFSFAAVISVIVIAKPLLNSYQIYIDENQSKLAKRLLEQFVFSFGITVGTLPIVVSMYYQIPLYSIPLNVMIIPLMPLLLGLGIVGGIGSLISPLIGMPAIKLCHGVIFIFEMLADVFSMLPGNSIITGKKSFALCILYVVLVYFIVNGNKVRKLKLPVLMLVALALIFPNKNKFEIDVLDVGQGDGIYISTGDGINCFIDGGSTSEKTVGEYRILPFLKYKGVAQIDYWFITHGDEDHLSGLVELLDEGYKVENIVISKYAVHTDDLDLLIAAASETRTNIIYIKADESIKTKHTTIKCVYPFEESRSDDPNQMSLSLLLKYDKNLDGQSDFSGFFGGDIGADEEKLISNSKELQNIDYLKVSHHGSKYSSDEKFLKELSPKVATISCARDNKYGHPAKEAVDRIEDVTSEIFYTMNSGRIRITAKKGIIVEEFCN